MNQDFKYFFYIFFIIISDIPGSGDAENQFRNSDFFLEMKEILLGLPFWKILYSS